MGRVFRALDPLLSRPVALKILFADTPSKLERFLVEARSQAQVDHPNVCRVYEAGFVEGRPYIAMQLVEGGTLSVALGEMTLEEKVRAFFEIAEGVHAAHRTGLVHRDIKPGNILVERTPEGGWRPLVADFGLAREAGGAGVTVTGQTVGTPAYMSPEQASGDPTLLDRRSDVYGLGATLYEALTLRPPFKGRSAVDVMVKVLNEDPPRPTKLRPELPKDLETIVLKCLEKEPSRRYDSARALAEDLGRWLDGEPIAAAPARPIERLARRVRRNRALSATLAAAALVALASTVFGAASLLSSQRRAAAAQRFGRDAAEIEALLRASALAPAHDVRPVRREVRARMASIERSMEELGRAAAAPGHEALGRGHLALGELAVARAHLEASLAAVPDAPRVRQALGVTLGRLWQQRRLAVDALSDPQGRADRRRELDAELRAPALAALRRGEPGGLAPALVAFYSQRFEEAERLASAALAAEPWSYEAALLTADARRERLSRAQDEGDTKRAVPLVASAEEAAQAALRIGESEPRAHEALCEMRARFVEQATASGAGDPAPLAERALAACEAGLRVDPERARLHTLESWILFQLGGAVARKGGEGDAILERSRQEARRAIALGADEVAWHELGTASLVQAQGATQKRLDPRPLLEDAIAALGKAIAIRPWARSLNNAGLALVYRADYEATHGLDPRRSLEEAVARLEEARRLSPRLAMAANNEVLALATRGEWESQHGADPRGSYEKGAKVARELLEKSPDFVQTLVVLGQLLQAWAEFELGRGGDAAPLVEEAHRRLAHALEIDPSAALAHEVTGALHVTRARMARRAGRDPFPELDAADESFLRGERLDPTNVGAAAAALDALAERAGAVRESGRDPAAEAARAEALFSKASRLNSDFAPLHVALASVLLERLRWDVERGRAPAAAARLNGLLSRALALTPEDAGARKLAGERDALLAQAARRPR